MIHARPYQQYTQSLLCCRGHIIHGRVFEVDLELSSLLACDIHYHVALVMQDIFKNNRPCCTECPHIIIYVEECPFLYKKNKVFQIS